MRVTADCKKHGTCDHEYVDVLECCLCKKASDNLTLELELQGARAGFYWGLTGNPLTIGPGPHEYEKTWEMAFEKGRQVRQRIDNRRAGKDYSLCPYDSHSADCDCKGMGGDR